MASARAAKNEIDHRAAPAPEGSDGNFRVRVAREKRERMRMRLLGAIMTICSQLKGRGPKVIDEVIREAKVSRGTFYKYFDTLEEAVSELGRILADDMVVTLSRMLADVEDPAMRISAATQITLVHAAIDHAWGGFASHTEHLTEDSFLVEAMRLNCEEGRRLGRFEYANIDAAIDFHMGLVTQCVRRMPKLGLDESYIREVAAIALIGLGVKRPEALRIAAETAADLAVRAPLFLPWWSTPTRTPVSSVLPEPGAPRLEGAGSGALRPPVRRPKN